MKKLFCLLLVLSVCVLAACGAQDAAQDPGPAPSVDGPVHEGTDIAGSPFVGTFENSYNALFLSPAKDGVYDGALPTLTLKEDGAFSMTVVATADGAVHTLSGTFTVDGDNAALTVDACDGEFYGSDTEGFTLTLTSENELRYSGPQMEAVSEGDLFERAQ